MSVVRVKNLRDVAFVDSFDGTTYSVNPAGSTIVPIEAAKLWFGNWDLVDKPSRALRERSEELQRLQVRYGCSDDPERWEATKPLVQVCDVDDPAGTAISEAAVTVDEHEDMLSMIRQQAKDLDRLKKDYQKQIRTEQPDSDADEDKPEPVASKRARRQ